MSWCKILWDVINEEKVVEKYSLAWSLCKILIVFPNLVWISVKKDVNIEKTLEHSFIKNNQVQCKKLSINETKYLRPEEVATRLGPQVS